MVELLPEKDIDGSGTTLCVLGLAHEFPQDYFEKLVKTGRVNSTVIKVDGQPFYRVIWEILAGPQVSVLLAQALGKPDVRYLGKGLDAIVKSVGGTSLIFSTNRNGLIAQAKTWGAEPFQVWLKKSYA